MSTSHSFPIFDGHNDTLLALYGQSRGAGATFFDQSTQGHLDFPRARAGGFGGGFFAVYIPADPADPPPAPASNSELGRSHWVLPPALSLTYSQKVAFSMTALLFRTEAASNGQFKVVRTADELEASLQAGILTAILHFEGAEPIDPELNALEVFYQAGLRSLGLVWSRPNAFAYGVPFAFPSSPDIGPGLTDLGKQLVRECNRLGILIDLSHLNEQGFWDVAKLSDAPLVATHSNVHALCATSRNLTDKQLDAIKASDGMVGLNFAVSFLREDGTGNPDTPISTMVNHIDYLVERLGIDRVGLGSDFDGATIPQELGDVAGLPKLVESLRNSGYDDESLRKLTHENWLRVLRKTWHS